MILCMGIYIGIVVFAVKYKQKYMREMLLILLFNTIALVCFWTEEGRMVSELRRPSYGQGKRTETLVAKVGEEELELSVDVAEQRYKKTEMKEVFERAEKKLDQIVLNGNPSFQQVTKDLKLVTKVPGMPIQVSWELSDYEVMDIRGVLRKEKLTKEGQAVSIRGTMQYQEEEYIYERTIHLYLPKETEEEEKRRELQNLAAKENERTEGETYFKLPDKWKGEEVCWEQKSGQSGYVVLIMGTVIVLLLPLIKKEKKKKEELQRESQMLRDYPDILNQFILLVRAGQTVKYVWRKIVEQYLLERDEKGIRYAYEEMSRTFNEMQSGIPEMECYERFGRRCNLKVYRKFAALLVQNLRKGTKELTEVLQMEAFQVTEERKARAKQLGEEAGTKLLGPMFLMLGVVLVVVIVPAFLSMNI